MSASDDGRAGRDEGIDRAAAGAGEWMAWADRRIRELAQGGQPFNADDLKRPRDPVPASPYAYGSAFMAAVRRGLIERTGETRPIRGERAHARRTSLYVGAGRLAELTRGQDAEAGAEAGAEADELRAQLARAHAAVRTLATAYARTPAPPRRITEAGGPEALADAFRLAGELAP